MKQMTVCFLLRNPNHREILLGFKKTGFGAGKFAGIGGKVESGETVHAAAVREVEEEIGVTIHSEDILFRGSITFTFPSKTEWSQLVFVYSCEKWSGEPRETSEIKPQWFNFENIPYDSMWQDAPYWIPQVITGDEINLEIVFKADNETVERVNLQSKGS